MTMADKVDPRLEPEHLENILCAKATGLRRRCTKLAHQRKTLMAMLRANHEQLTRCQAAAIEAEKALFEQRELIQKIETKKEPKKRNTKPADSDIMKALDTMSEHQRAALITKLMDSGIIKQTK